MVHERSKEATVVLIPRWGASQECQPDEARVFEIQQASNSSRIALHHLNAYECERNGKEYVVLDTMNYGTMSFSQVGST